MQASETDGHGGARLVHVEDMATSLAWRRLVGALPSTLFHSPAWMKVLQDTYGVPVNGYVLMEGGKEVAGLPWCEMDDLLGLRRVTLAFSDYCDPLGGNANQTARLCEAMIREGNPWVLRARQGFLPELMLPADAVAMYKWQVIDLHADEQSLWDALHSMAKRGVRKAEREGVEVRHALGKEDLRAWFLLHLRTRKERHRLLAQPYTFFEHIWDAFIEKGQGFLLLALTKGRIIGGTLYLAWRDTCYYKFNASHPEYLRLRPNNATFWYGLLEAKRRGYCSMDLGRSSADDEGLIVFKRNFGAKAMDLYALSMNTNGGPSPAALAARDTVRQLTVLLTRDSVPDEVTESAGEMLYRFFA